MQIIYIYLAETMENIAQPMTAGIERFKENPSLFFPDWDSKTMAFATSLLLNPILDETTGELREMSKEELYKAGKYILSENEIIENGKIKSIELSEFEYIENNKVKFKRDEKIESLKKELYTLRIEKEKEPFEFEVNGTKYLQNNRSIDQSNLTRIVVMCQATKKTTFDNWKFYTKDNSEKYVSISLTDMMKMAEIMQEQTTKTMATETLLSHNLENLTEEELKNYKVKERYEKAYGEMR